MNHNSREPCQEVIVSFTELTLVFIEEFLDKLLNFRKMFVFYIFCLLKKESSWILQCFHNLKYKNIILN